MNNKWLLGMALIIAVAAGAIAFSVTRALRCASSEADPLDRLQDVSFLTGKLGLSTEQAEKIQALHVTLGTTLNDCCSRHCAARARLGQALVAETNGTAQAEAILTEMCRAYEESERATLDQIRRVRAILNTEQRKQFDAMIADCMCRMCGKQGCNM